MPLVKLLEGGHIALSGFLCQRVIRFLLRLDFGCGHVFVLGQVTKDSLFTARSPQLSRVRIFQRSATFSSAFTRRVFARCLVALNAGVMQRFERVVALPDPKDIEFPQPQQQFDHTQAQIQ